MFNDASSEFDVLVASDAIGMGLNLNISRIIFSTLEKYDGTEMRQLTVSEIKQIAGRAGRYGSKLPVGEVTCLDAEDLPLLHFALKSQSPVLERAGLFPTFDLLYMYSCLHSKNVPGIVVSMHCRDNNFNCNALPVIVLETCPTLALEVTGSYHLLPIGFGCMLPNSNTASERGQVPTPLSLSSSC
ncbi:ATP-dependent RNA helicase [Actinidia rufa]|uniref:ATP-dependent RNA helicase n=1 Tax=Actinidia rufa TaxID=165716 RepID=A0A7J0GDN5_9ERIC|nr:ATP-dependent RNA helicase [Actinidia rufa]